MSDHPPIPFSEKTQRGKNRHWAERFLDEFGIGLVETAALVAIIARYRCNGDSSTLSEIAEFIQDEESLSISSLALLHRRGFIERIGHTIY